MKVYALLSHFDESVDHLTRCVTSLKGFADVIVALDGAYATFPDARAQSDSGQDEALHKAARDAGLAYSIKVSHGLWASEVEKRAALFELGRKAGATPDDWLLIIDGDMGLAEFTADARDRLAATELDVADVNWHDVQVNGVKCSTQCFRSLFRALPGLTVERTHYLYTVPTAPCFRCGGTSGMGYDGGACQTCHGAPARRFLWHVPSGHISPEPALDLTDAVTLHHYNSQRDPDRKSRALRYYRARDDAHLESAGDWR